MRIGFTMDFRNPRQEPWRPFWEDRLWLMVQAEAMGFDYLLVQEHFFCADGYAPSMPVFLTLLAERTKTARIGSYVYILPLHNAAQLAQETAVLDHLSEGRLDVTVGAGHNPAEYRAWGYDPRTRPSRMEEGLEVLKLAWTRRPFSYHGRYYDLQDMQVVPEPMQKPHPPLWVAATSPVAAERAGRHGAHLHGASVDPAVHAAYLRGLHASGHPVDEARISNPWSITVTREDPEKVWKRNEALYFERWDYYRRIRSQMGDADLQYGLTPGANAYRDHELIGDADAVLHTLRTFRDTLPLTDIVHAGPPGGLDIRGEVYPRLKDFAEQVLPELKRW
ncbi:MAG: LLM class flavin-dependent oxidoreductase [Gammaproteobacteria bacterium]|nr:LLM class flavin-dependent oxidoreductase [Gammaproteobacteria bacterium]